VNKNIRLGYAEGSGSVHWLQLILAASIFWLSAAAHASDNQQNTEPNPNPSTTPAIAVIPTPTTPPATTSTVNDNRGQVFDVKTYGAVGDGSTDDTAAIRSAITAASATGGVVFFPPGVFVLPSRLTCKSLNNVSFQGSGKSTTILKSAVPVSFPPRNGGPTMLAFDDCANFSIRNITFDNNNIITALRSCMVSVSSSTNFTVSNCAFINAKHFILSIESSSRFSIKDNYFNCTELNGKVFTGAIMLFDDISRTSDGQIVNNEIVGAESGGRGVGIVWSHNRITNFGFGAGIFSGHDGVGFGTHNWTVTGNSITGGQPARDGCGFYPKGIEVYAPGTKIIGNKCYNNSGSGIVFGGRNSIVANNSCFNNGRSDNKCSGIVATYVPPNIDPSNSTVTGNICRNVGAGFQHYGFSYEWGNLLGFEKAKASGLHFSGNDFSGNLLGEMKRMLPPGRGQHP
jgi:parallel beta-helix repeat protein